VTPPGPDLAAPPPCWRCGLPADPVGGACPHCRARLGPPAPAKPSDRPHPLLGVITAYAVMLTASLVWGWVVHFSDGLGESGRLVGTAVLEGFDTALVLITALAIGRVSVPRPARRVRAAAWVTAPVALAAVLATNVAYRAVLAAYLRPGWAPEPAAEPGWSALTVVLCCVQPAVVEEWFFRYLALGAVRTAAGTHAAVWVSAVMFALAHVYNPLGLPWLLLAGVVFGYWRVAGGGLALPILMHFAHNAVILGVEGFA